MFMRLSRVRHDLLLFLLTSLTLITILFLFFVVFAPSSLADDTSDSSDASRATRNGLSANISEDYTLSFPTFTTFDLSGEYAFERIFYEGDVRNASYLQEAYQNGSAGQRADIIDFLESQVGVYLNNVLNTTFEKSTNQNITFSVDVTSLNDANYTGPVKVLGTGEAELTNDNFGFDEDIEKPGEIIEGVFRMGAELELDIFISAPEGSRRTLMVTPPNGIKILSQSLNYSAGHPGYVVWDVDNTSGAASPQTGKLYLRSKSPSPATKERIDVNIVVDWKAFNSTEIRVVLEAYSLEVAKYSDLSSHIRGLDYIPADGVRMALDNALGTWEDQAIKKQAAENATLEIEDILSDSLDQPIPLDLGFDWNDSSLEAGYDVSTMSSTPPLQAAMTSGPVVPNLYPLEEMFEIDDLDVIRGFLNAGASAEFAIDPMDFSAEYSPTIRLILPENMRLPNVDAAEQQDGERYSYSWDPADGVSGDIISTKAPLYDQSKVELDATLDFKKFKVDILAIESSSLSTDFAGELRFHHFELTDVIRDLLPLEVNIDYINADVLRMVYDKDLVDFDELEKMLKEKTEEYETKISESLGEKIYINIDILESTLEGYDIENMDNSPPIEITGSTHVDIPLAGGGDKLDEGQSSFILKSVNFDFEVPALEGWKINLTVILPKGIEIIKVTDNNGNVDQVKSGGRDAFSVVISDESNHVYMELGITPALIYETCQTYIFISIGIAVLLMIRRKRKKMKHLRKEEEEEMAEAERALPDEQIFSLQSPGPGFQGLSQQPGAPPPSNTVPSLISRRDDEQ